MIADFQGLECVLRVPVMIMRLIAKILLKATIPLVAVAGISSYMLYLKGGDPMMLAKLAGSAFKGQTSSLMGSAKDSTRDALGGLGGHGDKPAKSTLYRWTDASGTTHFGNAPPVGNTNAVQLTIDPNQNMIPSRKPAVVKTGGLSEPLPMSTMDSSGAAAGPTPGQVQNAAAAGIEVPGINSAAMIEQLQKLQLK